jgi:ubiquinone/menaquinone biosynthesis C-methylase UbiE
MNLKELKRNWDQFGEIDPLWAIVTAKDKKENKWDEKEFFATGKLLMEQTIKEARQINPSLKFSKALDFGCGVGRLTLPMSDYFVEVVGVDIAPSMIRLAEKYKTKENCKFILNDKPDLRIFNDESFDFIVSFITLQHMAPRYSKKYIKEFARILKPGGMMVFNLPSGLIVYPKKKGIKEFFSVNYIKRILGFYRSKKPTMEMYYINEDEIIRLLEKSRIKVIKSTNLVLGNFIFQKYRGIKI